MPGHVEDRWYKTEAGADGKPRRVRTDRYGKGSRYRARYTGPDGTEQSKSFPDRQKRQAEDWLDEINVDMSRGQYVDPKAAKTTFRQFGEKWLAAQTTDPGTRVMVEMRIRLHAFPALGSRPLGSFRPNHIREWVKGMEAAGLAPSYARTIYANVRALLSAAVDDGLLARNPCSARSVRAPSLPPKRIVPWTTTRVRAVRAGLPDRFRTMVDLGAGCGLRQGEIFGVGPDGVDSDAGTLHVVRQIKLVDNVPVFAPPKGGRTRDVPLPTSVANAVKQHAAAFPPVEITLPWLRPDGPPATHHVLFTTGIGSALRRENFNVDVWKPALVAAGDPASRPRQAAHLGARARHARAPALLRLGAPRRGGVHQGCQRVPWPRRSRVHAEGVRAPHAAKQGSNRAGNRQVAFS